MFGENLHIGSVIKQQLNDLVVTPHGGLDEGWRQVWLGVIDEDEMDRLGVHRVLHGHIAPLGRINSLVYLFEKIRSFCFPSQPNAESQE